MGTSLSDLTLTDDLDAVFGAGNYTVTPLSVASVISSGSSTINVNSSFNGSTDQNILAAGSSLAAFDTVQIRLNVTVTTIADQGGGLGVYANQATATGQTPTGTTVTDLSTQGSNPDLDAFAADGLTADSGTGANDSNGDATDNSAYTRFTIAIPKDYGDAPENYGDAAHQRLSTPTIYLGSVAPDTEASSLNAANGGANGTGDDSSGTDDEDGVTISGLAQTLSSSLSVRVTGSGYLNAWIDWAGDESFSTAGDQIASNIQDGGSGDLDGSANGVIQLLLTVPAGSATSTYARFRYSSTPGLTPTSLATDGEVEDYAVSITPETRPSLTCSTDPLILNSGYDGIGGKKLPGTTDTYWDAGVGTTAGYSSVTNWVNAYVVGNKAPGAWANSPFSNAEWISAYSDANHSAFGNSDTYYRFRFDIDPLVDPDQVVLNIDFYSDNAAYEIYVNGVAQSTHYSSIPNSGAADPYQYQGYIAANRLAMALAEDFVTGTNEIIVHIKSGVPYEGFLAQFTSTSVCQQDFGDAPASYGDARHVIPVSPTVFLGALAPDSEASSQNSSGANGDDTAGTDDEDGISFSKLLTSSSSNYSIATSNITLSNTSGTTATLHAWIDFDKDGSFEASEYASVTINSGTSGGHPTTPLSWAGLSGLTTGTTYARFRLTTSSLSDSGATSYDDRALGAALDGEVEDYSLSIVAGISGTVFKDEDSNDSFGGTDTGVADVTVKLYKDSNSNGLFEPLTDTLIDTDVSMSAGSFILGTSGSGTYFVVLDHLDTDMPAAYLPDRTVRAVSFSGSSLSNQNFPLDPNTPSLASCTVSAFLFQNNPSDVYGLNLATGSSTLLANDIGGIHVNGIGFNPLDNFIYGASNTVTNGSIAKVDGNFNVSYLGPIVGLPTTSYVVGDISPDGKLYFYASGKMQIIDVNPSSATYLQVTSRTLSQTLSIADWAFNPIDEMIYVVANNTKNLYRVNPDTAVVTDLGNTGVPGSAGFGAQFYDADGFFYISNNPTGYIYRIDTRNPASISPTATFFAFGPISSTNDGARCMYAPVLNDYGDAPSSYKTLLNDSGAKHDISLGTSYYLGSTAPDAEIDGQPSSAANADGSDEDGVSWQGNPLADQVLSYMDNSSLMVSTTGEAYLQAWIDWDRNGLFDSDEQIAKNLRPVAGQIVIPFSVPFDAVAGVTYARFRYSSDLDLGPTGPASDGEIEDYRLTLANSGVSGTVFYDDGRGGGTANNSLQDGTELGASGIRITATDGTMSVSTLTDGGGNYALQIPPWFGPTVTLSHDHYPATGSSVFDVFVPNCLATSSRDPNAAKRIITDTDCSRSIDGLEPGYVAGSSYSQYDFGIIEAVSLIPDQSAQASSPDTVSYTHLFTPGTLGQVSLSLSGGRYSYQVFLDGDCGGSIDGAEQTNVLTTGFTVGSGWARDEDGRLAACALELRVSIPAGEADGRLDIVGLEASLHWASSEMVTDESSVTDMTTLNSGATLEVTKRVRNLSAAGAFAIRTEGIPGDVLEYCISYQNIGVNALENVSMSDPLPYFTSFNTDAYDNGAGDQSIEWQAATTRLLTAAADADAASFDGQFVWLTVGTVQAGETGSLCYQVSID